MSGSQFDQGGKIYICVCVLSLCGDMEFFLGGELTG